MADSCKNLAQTGDFLRDHDGGDGGRGGGQWAWGTDRSWRGLPSTIQENYSMKKNLQNLYL